MAFGSVTLVPGVNVERTPALLRAGVAQSRLIRYRDSLIQKIGGWSRLYSFAVAGVPRDLHAWQDLHAEPWLGVATTLQLNVIEGCGCEDIALKNVTPQTLVTDFAPNISTTSGSPIVDIVDPNIANVTVYDSVFFNVPVSQGGIILDGLYPITEITGTSSYQITATMNATDTTSNPTATNNTTANGNDTLHFATTPAWVREGMTIYDLTDPTAIPAGTVVSGVSGTTVTMSQTATGSGVGNGDSIIFSSVPVFTTTADNAAVLVTFLDHGLSVGNKVNFPVGTTGNGVTIQDDFTVATVPSVDTFTITAPNEASASGSFVMNDGNAELTYYIALGPPALGIGYGLGNYGEGGYGTGVLPTDQSGSDIAADDWTIDNWGEILISCPKNGPIFYWGPTSGFQNSQLISNGPPFSAGIFVSMSQQIVVAFGSSVELGIGWQRQPLLVQWCTVGDFLTWEALETNQAGNYTIPVGSELVGGMATPNQNLLWTDIDCWSMLYIGPPNVFGFNKIGAGAGLVSTHAAQQLRGGVYWMGRANYYSYLNGNVAVIPCNVWDSVFQNLNTDYLQNIRAMPNTPYNEVGWLFPSKSSANGEVDSYAKFNITEPGAPWDYGPINRSAWIDQSILGMPIGANSNGVIYQHETTQDADGQPITSSFTTGYFYLSEGEDFVFVDQIYPDFKWATYTGTGSAQIQISFNIVNHLGETPKIFGPYTVTRDTKFLSVRLRGRMMSITITSSDLGSFWRIGSMKYRYSVVGRR